MLVNAESEDAGAPQARFLFEVVQDLLDAEAKRDDAANGRAIAVVALSGAMLAVTASVTAGALRAGVDRGWRVVALVLLVTAVTALGAAAACAMVGVLRPRRFAMLATAEVKKFTTDEYLGRSNDANHQVLLTGLVDILEHERSRSADKATWLRRSYALILLAVAALAVIGVLGAFRGAGIIPSHHGVAHRSRLTGAVAHGAAALGATARGPGAAAETPAPAPTHRIRREGSA